MNGRRPRVLFIAEAVTLAHVARPLALASSLNPGTYEVIFASEPRFGEPWQNRGLAARPIRSIPTDRFLAALAEGKPVYDFETLESYVADDLELLDLVQPDVVVGDFRLSLSVSARLARVPYLAITNAYWSPFAVQGYPMPELGLSRVLGVRLASLLFLLARPIAFEIHARPMNRLRKAHGLGGPSMNLRAIYTDADHTLYADVPELVLTRNLPPSHYYLGPIPWSPTIETPPWWDSFSDDRPLIYATLGSSGRPQSLATVLEALADLPVRVIAASAGRPLPTQLPANVRIAPYLPGEAAASRSSLVICNGGSPTTYQALGQGRPVIGLAENMDQHLNMAGIVRQGAGLLVRSEEARPKAIRRAVETILGDPSFRTAAEDVSATFARYNAFERFRAILDEVISGHNRTSDRSTNLPGGTPQPDSQPETH